MGWQMTGGKSVSMPNSHWKSLTLHQLLMRIAYCATKGPPHTNSDHQRNGVDNKIHIYFTKRPPWHVHEQTHTHTLTAHTAL